MTPITISSLAIIIFAALIHASFQLSLSVLTLLSGHSIGKKTAHRKVLRLMNCFISGVFTITMLLITTIAYYLLAFVNHSESVEQLVAAIVCGLMVGLGIATWAFYYRRSEGTALWLPRGFAHYLNKRSKATRGGNEAFALGMASVIAEIVFIIGPVLAASLAIITLPNSLWQVGGILLYVFLSMLPMLIMTIMVGSGHSVARLQRWREQNKRFLQFVGGGSLFILAAFIFVDRILGIITYGGL